MRPWGAPCPGSGSQGQVREAARTLARLPPYQVALWPDGWEDLEDGGILVRDTDAMAEARRWYQLAGCNGAVAVLASAMRLDGTCFVPHAILSLTRQRFASPRVASVAVQLVAGDWVAARRAQLLRDPVRALRERAQTWSGSRSGGGLDPEGLGNLLWNLMDQCAAEGLTPRACYGLKVQRANGYGLGGLRCVVETRLDPYARAHLADALSAALIPWNRAVIRDGRPCRLISVEVRRPAAAVRATV